MTEDIAAPRITTAVGPNASGPTGKPLLLLLHGYGSNERDLPGLVPQLGGDWDWISVRAPFAMDERVAAWFAISAATGLDRTRISASLGALLEFLDGVVVAGQPIVPIGFSQGGLMALELLRARPESVPAAVVLSGFVDPEAREVDARVAQVRPKTFFGRGDSDESTIPEAAFTATEDWLREHTQAEIRVYPNLGHAVSPQEVADLRDFLAGLDLG